MTRLSHTESGKKWLRNFDACDRATASTLIDRLSLVSSSEFVTSIAQELEKLHIEAESANHFLGIYAEKEVSRADREIEAFFPGTDTGRAIGKGTPPIAIDPETQEVGSEGILASLITKFCKQHRLTCLSHPGPDVLREKRVKKIVIVTDFIGSGRRVYDMLTAYAKVASIQSWRSYGLISFQVIAYSGTETGLDVVLSHPLRPTISCFVACPTIDEAFEGEELGAIRSLCKKYPKGSRWPFGFRGSGALIAFAHGIPNNAPDILHKDENGWEPLFRGRSTFAAEIDRNANRQAVIVENSDRALNIRNAKKCLESSDGEQWLHVTLVLIAVKRGMKTEARLSAETQLPIEKVRNILQLGMNAKWLTPKPSLTALGRRELKYSRWRGPDNIALVSETNSLYFPKQLRAS